MLRALSAAPAASAPVSSKGRTEDFESSNRGSNPRTGTTTPTPGEQRGNGAAVPLEERGAAEGPYQECTSTPGEPPRPTSHTPTTSMPITPRAGAIARLAGELAALAAAGDLEGARLVQETIGRLLAPAARTSTDASGGALVVDLDAERERRTGR